MMIFNPLIANITPLLAHEMLQIMKLQLEFHVINKILYFDLLTDAIHCQWIILVGYWSILFRCSFLFFHNEKHLFHAISLIPLCQIQ